MSRQLDRLNRDQLITHITLLGGAPAKFQDRWIGLAWGKRNKLLYYDLEDRGVHRAANDQKLDWCTPEFATAWDFFTDRVLRLLAEAFEEALHEP